MDEALASAETIGQAPAPSPPDELLGWIAKNPAWAAAALVPLFLAVKLVVVADGSISTALALLDGADVSDVLIGTFVANLPLLGIVLYLIAWAWIGIALVTGRNRFEVFLGAGVLLTVSFLIAPAPSEFDDLAGGAFSAALIVAGGAFPLTQLVPWWLRHRWGPDHPKSYRLMLSTRTTEPQRPALPRDALQAYSTLLDADEKQKWNDPTFEQDKVSALHRDLIESLSTLSASLEPGSEKRDVDGAKAEIERLKESWSQKTGKANVSQSEVDEHLRSLDQTLEGHELKEIRKKVNQLHQTLEARRSRWVSSASLMLRLTRQLAILAALLGTILVFASAEMWLPAERIQTPESPRLVGYVLDAGEADTVILLERERQIRRFKSSEVGEREICSLEARLFDHSMFEAIESTYQAIERRITKEDARASAPTSCF
jgi:hypothetical protein